VYIQLITKAKKQLCELNERKPVEKYAKKLSDTKGKGWRRRRSSGSV